MMKNIVRFLLPIIVICSCNSNTDSQKKDNGYSNNAKVIAKNDLAERKITECIPNHKDTSNREFSVKYIDSVTFYTIQLRIGKINRVLDYRFDCNTVGSTVPNFKAYKGEWLCLSRGCGDHCLIYYLFQKEDNKIKEFRSFDQAYAIDLENSYCAVIDKESDYPAVLIIDYLKNKCVSKPLKKHKSFHDIVEFRLTKNKIDIIYNDNSKEVIVFLDTDFTKAVPKFTEADQPPSVEN